MKTAFAHWNNRIAPVFDTAQQIFVVEADLEQVVGETYETLTEEIPIRKALRLVELGICTLVCGAISRPLHELIAAYGIRVIPFLAGDLREVVQAWLHNDLERDTFAMPGCCGSGQGQSRSGQKPGRMVGPLTADDVGTCFCPKCGHREPHERGVPCMQKQCPKCGTSMTRE